MLEHIYLTLQSACMVIFLTSATVNAQGEPSARESDSKQYFQWSSGQGGAPQQPDPYCGDTHENQDERTRYFSVHRDLGQGVNVRAGIGRDGRDNVFAILLFRHYEGALSLTPGNIVLSVPDSGAFYKPSKVLRTAYLPKNSKCQQVGEWVELEFPVKSIGVKFAELKFPSGTAIKQSDLNITPFGFQRIK